MKGNGSTLKRADAKWLSNLAKMLSEEGFYTKSKHLNELVDNANVFVCRPCNRPNEEQNHLRRA